MAGCSINQLVRVDREQIRYPSSPIRELLLTIAGERLPEPSQNIESNFALG